MSTFQTQHFLFLSKLESKNLEKESKKKRGKKTPDVAWKVDWDRIGCFH